MSKEQFNRFKNGTFGTKPKWSQYVKQDKLENHAGDCNRICRGVFLIKLFEDLNVLPRGTRFNNELKSYDVLFRFCFCLQLVLDWFNFIQFVA